MRRALAMVAVLALSGCGELSRSELQTIEATHPCDHVFYKPLACRHLRESEQIHTQAQEAEEQRAQEAP